jgi:hypothetical protein
MQWFCVHSESKSPSDVIPGQQHHEVRVIKRATRRFAINHILQFANPQAIGEYPGRTCQGKAEMRRIE